MYSIEIETKNLILRDIRQSDANAMFEMDSNPIVHKYLGKNPVKTLVESKNHISSIIDQYKNHGVGRWAVVSKSNGEFMGWSGLKLNTEITLNKKTNFYDIGYRFIPKYWGNGYASESAFAVLQYGFNLLELPLICGIAECENKASNRILKKLGLHFKNEFLIETTRANWYELNKSDYATTMS